MTGDRRYTIRSLDPQTDAQRNVHLLNAVEDSDREPDRTTEEGFREQLTWPKRRRWVVEAPYDPDTLIGYGVLFEQTSERAEPYPIVHPDWRRKGVGTQLLDFMLDRARETSATHASIFADARHAAANAFLRRNGFEAAGSAWLLHAPSDVSLEAPRWPDGYHVRTYAEVRDLATLVRTMNLSRRDMWGHAENTEGAVTEETVMRGLPRWDPEGIFMLFAPDGDVAGICRAQPGGDSPDYIDAPTLAPEHRRYRLQRPLLLAAMRWLRERGRQTIRMDPYGDDEQTIDLYREIGFILDQHFIGYRRDLKRA
jgi:mycothiol synthase